MRLSFVAFLLAAVWIAGCSGSQSLVGRWGCTTRHPGGIVSNDIFDFSDQGTMTLDSDGMVMHGSYHREGATLTMQLRDVPVPSPSGARVTQPQTLVAAIRKIGAKELEMDVSTGSQHHLSSCRRY